MENDETDFDDDKQFCEYCGNGIIPYEDGHCPSCKECGGDYTPGSEECDWCEFADECASLSSYNQ